MTETSLLTPEDEMIKAHILRRINLRDRIFYNSRKKEKIRQSIWIDKDIFSEITDMVNLSKKSRSLVVNEILKQVFQID